MYHCCCFRYMIYLLQHLHRYCCCHSIGSTPPTFPCCVVYAKKLTLSVCVSFPPFSASPTYWEHTYLCTQRAERNLRSFTNVGWIEGRNNKRRRRESVVTKNVTATQQQLCNGATTNLNYFANFYWKALRHLDYFPHNFQIYGSTTFMGI